MVFWLTGLSGSGKTTLGKYLAEYLRKKGHPVLFLDGDMSRRGLCRDLGFTLDDRRENVRRIAACAAIAEQSRIISCVACIAPLIEHRTLAKSIINSFHEIYISCPLAICQRRDPKGYYQQASNGIRQLYTGISSPYEPPQNPALILETGYETEGFSKATLLEYASSILN